jgi:GH24 family phage-related lysozyme (muramidase)
MALASVRSAAEHAARQGHLTPHQLAAFTALDESLTEPQRQGFTELWRAQGSPAAPIPPTWIPPEAWLAPAMKIIRDFEGCRLEAYRCPAGVWTIGYGTTRYPTPGGGPVRKGDTITQSQAEEYLRLDLLNLRGPALLSLLPMATTWPPNRMAALVSWAYNVGLAAVEDSTLRKRLNAGEDPVVVVTEELPRWNKANGEVSAGLVRRRNAEVALFVGHPLQQQKPMNPLTVPHFSQLDSDTDQGRRMCFSSSCAMMLATLKPGVLTGPNGDDQYLRRVQQYGDTIDPNAQVKALASYGVKAKFTRAAGWRTLEDQIAAGIPIPCGYLHRGPVTAPSGGGHWLCVVGIDPTHVIVHDPLGESNLVDGSTLPNAARYCYYSRKNWGLRWMVEGINTGWAILAER